MAAKLASSSWFTRARPCGDSFTDAFSFVMMSSKSVRAVSTSSNSALVSLVESSSPSRVAKDLTCAEAAVVGNGRWRAGPPGQYLGEQRRDVEAKVL